MVLPCVFIRVCSRFRLVVVEGPGGLPTRRTRALRRALRISCTRDACSPLASVSVRMAGFQLPAHRHRPDLVDRKDGTQVGRFGGLRRLLALGDGLQLLPAVQVEPPCRRPVPGLRQATPRPPLRVVEGMAWVPGAGCPRHDGR